MAAVARREARLRRALADMETDQAASVTAHSSRETQARPAASRWEHYGGRSNAVGDV